MDALCLPLDLRLKTEVCAIDLYHGSEEFVEGAIAVCIFVLIGWIYWGGVSVERLFAELSECRPVICYVYCVRLVIDKRVVDRWQEAQAWRVFVVLHSLERSPPHPSIKARANSL